MGWKCSRCGTDNDEHATVCHGMCGYVRFGKLILVSSETGEEVRMNVDTPVGKSLLKRLVGDEARFASEPQFQLRRSEAQSAWVIVPDEKAVNATYVNGAKAEGCGVKIDNGAEITIGTDKVRLKVRVQF
jgi:hypothetical protein